MQDPAIPRELDVHALDCVPGLRLHPGTALDLAGGAQAPARAHPGAGRTATARSSATGAGLLPASTAAPTKSSSTRLREQLSAGGATPDDRRRAAGRVPLRRDRLVGRRRCDGGRLSSTPVKTFSIGFDDRRATTSCPAPAWSPSASAPTTTSSWSSPTRSRCSPSSLRHYGEPFADSSAIPTFYLAEMTREHVTVALNGDGGDESFAGYPRHVANARTAWLDRVPRPIRAAGAAAGRAIPPSADRKSRRDYVRRMLVSLTGIAPERYREHVSIFDDNAVAEISDNGAKPLRLVDQDVWTTHGRERARPTARRRREHLPPGRSPSEGGHRDDGSLSGSPIAAARPRSHGAGGLHSHQTHDHTPPREEDPARDVPRHCARRSPRRPEVGVRGAVGGLVSGRVGRVYASSIRVSQVATVPRRPPGRRWRPLRPPLGPDGSGLWPRGASTPTPA